MNYSQISSDFGKRFQFNVGEFTVEPQIWQVAAIVFLLFLLVVTLASMRRHFLEWSVKGAGFGVILGFILALVLEGFLLVGGKTLLIEVLGWKNPPKPVENALELGREKFIQVLGVSDTDPCKEAD